MDKRVVVELIDAIDRAHECREGWPVQGAVCHRCWADVHLALAGVRKVYKPEGVTKVPVV